MLNPAHPLTKKTYEKFAKQRAETSRDLASCWGHATGREVTTKNRDSLKISGFRVDKRPEVIGRIAYMREQAKARRLAEQEQIEVPEGGWTQSDVLQIMLETTTALESCYDALCRPDVDVSDIKKRQYYSVLSSHLARQYSSLGSVDGDAVDLPKSAVDLAPINKMQFCRCDQ